MTLRPGSDRLNVPFAVGTPSSSALSWRACTVGARSNRSDRTSLARTISSASSPGSIACGATSRPNRPGSASSTAECGSRTVAEGLSIRRSANAVLPDSTARACEPVDSVSSAPMPSLLCRCSSCGCCASCGALLRRCTGRRLDHRGSESADGASFAAGIQSGVGRLSPGPFRSDCLRCLGAGCPGELRSACVADGLAGGFDHVNGIVRLRSASPCRNAGLAAVPSCRLSEFRIRWASIANVRGEDDFPCSVSPAESEGIQA